MNYTEARSYLKEVNKYGSVLGLESITTLLDALGNPQKELKVVHIAGTNGKGSTLAFIQSVLVKLGYQTGRYSSPLVSGQVQAKIYTVWHITIKKALALISGNILQLVITVLKNTRK